LLVEILARTRSPIARPEFSDEDEIRVDVVALLSALKGPIVTGLDLPRRGAGGSA